MQDFFETEQPDFLAHSRVGIADRKTPREALCRSVSAHERANPGAVDQRHVAQVDNHMLHTAAQRGLDLTLELFGGAARRQIFVRRENQRFPGRAWDGYGHVSASAGGGTLPR